MGVIIMGGEFRGRRLETDTRSQVIRPTSGKVREALFSSLGERVPGSAFVDLYAGSGAVGLEALSRGAGDVLLVESHPQSWALLTANCRAVTGRPPAGATDGTPARITGRHPTGVTGRHPAGASRAGTAEGGKTADNGPGGARPVPVRADALAFCREMAAGGRRFDIVFADPPFDRGGDFAVLPGLIRGILAEDGTAVVQFPFRTPPAWLAQAAKVRRYGESGLAFFDFPGLPAGA